MNKQPPCRLLCCILLLSTLTSAFHLSMTSTTPTTVGSVSVAGSATTAGSRRSPPLTQSSYAARLHPSSKITSTDVATLPKPGTSSPSSIQFHVVTGTISNDDVNERVEKEVWVTYLLPSDATSLTRELYATRVVGGEKTIELFQPTGTGGTESDFSLEEKVRKIYAVSAVNL